MTDNDNLLLAKIQDLIRLCDKYACARFSDFMDGGEIAFLENEFHFPYGYNYMLFGGCDDCERKILGVFPEWEEASKDTFPISVLKIEGGFNKTLTHRDYLGTIMSLGIERKKTGDILVNDRTAYIFVYEDVADYIKNNIRKIGNQGVKIDILGLTGFEAPKRRFKRIDAVCASARLDAVAAAAAKISRHEISSLINSGKVKLNYREINEVSKTVKPGDLISIRGFGRYILSEIGDETRKGRFHIVLNKYI